MRAVSLGGVERVEKTFCLTYSYDGKLWKEFMKVNDSDFLSQPNSYGVMLNVDFFQPYKHIQYSLCGVYLTVLNLPRDMRHKQSWWIDTWTTRTKS